MKITVKILIVVLIIGAVASLAFFLFKKEPAQVDIPEPPPPEPIITPEPEPPVPSEVEGEPEPTLPPPKPEPLPAEAPAEEGPPPPREPQEFIITIYSNERAEPANLTIHVGDTVTMVNADDALHWPGADPHPTHSSLPPFDALGGLSKGQSFSYTFRETGTWGYHEHLLDDPPTIGFVTVLP